MSLRPRTANGSVFATQSVAFGLDFVHLLGLVAEPASPAKAGPARPAEAEAGCLSGPAGLGGITSLVIIRPPAFCFGQPATREVNHSI